MTEAETKATASADICRQDPFNSLLFWSDHSDKPFSFDRDHKKPPEFNIFRSYTYLIILDICKLYFLKNSYPFHLLKAFEYTQNLAESGNSSKDYIYRTVSIPLSCLCIGTQTNRSIIIKNQNVENFHVFESYDYAVFRTVRLWTCIFLFPDLSQAR